MLASKNASIVYQGNPYLHVQFVSLLARIMCGSHWYISFCFGLESARIPAKCYMGYRLSHLK